MKLRLILLFIILISISIEINAQINYEDSTVQAITYWNLNESYTYEIIQSKDKAKNHDEVKSNSTRSLVKITVIDSTQNSYTIEWQFLECDIPNLELVPELKSLLNATKYIYKTNELGEFSELLNWEEVRDNTLAITKAGMTLAFKEKGIPQNDSISNTVNLLAESLMSKEYIEQKVIESVNIFHSFFGIKYKLGEILESEIDVPIPIPNMQSAKAQMNVWLDTIDSENSSYILCLEQQIDQSVVKRLIKQFLEGMSNRLNVENNSEVLDDALLEDLEYSIVIHSEFDNSGWPLDIVSRTNISLGSNQQNNTIQFKLVE